mgnify:FL=1
MTTQNRQKSNAKKTITNQQQQKRTHYTQFPSLWIGAGTILEC